MAARALVSKGWLVSIAVTIGADLELQTGPLFFGMAFPTGHLLMRTLEDVSRRVVIVPIDLEGDLDGVALIAVLDELPPVHIFMAGAAA